MNIFKKNGYASGRLLKFSNHVALPQTLNFHLDDEYFFPSKIGASYFRPHYALFLPHSNSNRVEVVPSSTTLHVGLPRQENNLLFHRSIPYFFSIRGICSLID